MPQSVLRYIEQPALLAEVPKGRILELIARYPYLTNLRLLLLLKAQQENDPEFENYLSRFASSTFDRAHLYNLLAGLEAGEEESGEVLELLELEELELAPIHATPADEEEFPSRLNELPGPVPLPPSPSLSLSQSVSEPEFTDLVAKPVTAKASFRASDRWLQTADAYFGLLSGNFRAKSRPEDPAIFARMLAERRTSEDLKQRLRNLRRAITSARPPAARQQGVVVSETLADLLVKQEQFHDAIRMYRRLILLYPEKKPIFAGLIEELKEKL